MLAIIIAQFSLAAEQPLPLRMEDQISTVKAAIQASGAQWQAGETSMSRLSKESRHRRIGMFFDKFKAKPLVKSAKFGASSASVPSSVDWRNDGGNYVTPIRDQGECGGCWAFSMTGGLESYTLIKNHASGKNLDLAEQILISCSGIGSCDGGTISPDYLQSTGLPPESAYPYTATNGSCSSAAAGWQNKTYKIDGWGSIDQTVNALKEALAEYGPLPAAFMVYEDFMHYSGGVYSYTSGAEEGGHAILIVGYNDSGKYFIVKNSWGTNWGESGFFRIAYSQVTSKKVQFGLSAVAYQGARMSESDKALQAKMQQKSFDSDAAMRRISGMMNRMPQ